jgi:hypothetical protein
MLPLVLNHLHLKIIFEVASHLHFTILSLKQNKQINEHPETNRMGEITLYLNLNFILDLNFVLNLNFILNLIL